MPKQPGHPLCTTCQARAEGAVQAAERQNAVRLRKDVLLAVYTAQVPPLPWTQVATEVFALVDPTLGPFDRQDVAMRYFRSEAAVVAAGGPDNHPRALWVFRMFWRDLVRHNANPVAVPAPVHPPRAAPRQELGRLAADRQNVHTTHVSTQTNKAVELLLAVHVPETQQTEVSMARNWMSRPGGFFMKRYLEVACDVNNWFNTRTCRADNDNLYRRLLRGLVATIERQDDERKTELYKRLWEECYEAVGMCCEGHIGRLCNVLVGFDESFQPPVPLGELLQNKMAAIAAQDIPEEDKRRQATAFFNEVGLPDSERAAWLDAF
jgi:hypothetical protein